MVHAGGGERAELRSRPPFLVVEGNNGTGKSTVAGYLAGRLGARLFHFPPAFVRFRETARLDEQINPIPRLLYYLAASVHLSDLAGEALLTGPVVCDRYLAAPVSLLLAERALPHDEVLRMVTPIEGRVLRPDLILLLRADHAVATERVQARAERDRSGALTVVERRMSDPEVFRRREGALRDYSHRLGPLSQIDTTALSIESMTAAAWAAIGGIEARSNRWTGPPGDTYHPGPIGTG